MRVVIAGGGTGGHLFPGIALAEEFVKRDRTTEIIFIGTKKGIESRLLEKIGYELRTIDIEGVKGRGMKALLKGLYQIPVSLWQSRRILKQFRPDLVFGVGGYASGPAVLAAHFMNVPTAVAEQNAIPGVTNKILGKFADRIFVTYAQTRTFFSPEKVVFSGNPVRASLSAGTGERNKDKTERCLLIFGGSQGAEAINQSVMDMLPQLQSLTDKIKILHQTGLRQLEDVRKAYAESGIRAVVKDFIVDMAQAYAEADLIICRAGATSLAEITAAGKASVLIPFPWAANDHQLKNAQAMEKEGAAKVIREKDLSGAKLFEVVKNLLADEKQLQAMERNALKMSKPDAAETIIDDCLKLVSAKK